MAYQQDGLIEATDYNGLVGSTTSAPANTLNAIWRNGTANDAGYGQVALPQVAVRNKITADNWQDLVNTSTSIATHQGTSITPVTAPVARSIVTHQSAIPTNLQLMYSNRLNAATQGSTDSNTLTRTGQWITLTATHTIVFTGNTAADSFFNAGGQLKFTAAHPNGTSAGDVAIRNLCNNIGTVVISAPDSGTATIIGTNFNGVTKIGGGGSTPTINQNRGYYGLTTGDVEFFRQNSAAVPYTNSNISMQSRLNNSTVTVTITITYNDPSNPGSLASGTNFTVVAQYPETTNLSNTWGFVTLSGTIEGGTPPANTPDISFAPTFDFYFKPFPVSGETAGIIFGLFGDGGIRKDGRNFGTNDGRYTVQLENRPIGSTWVPSGANATDYEIQISFNVLNIVGSGTTISVTGTNINVPSAGINDSGTSGWRTLATNDNTSSVFGNIEINQNTGQRQATVRWTVQVRNKDDNSIVVTDVQDFGLEVDIS